MSSILPVQLSSRTELSASHLRQIGNPFGKHFTSNDIFLYSLCITMPIIEEAIFLGTPKWCQMLDRLIVFFKNTACVLVLHTKSSREQPPKRQTCGEVSTWACADVCAKRDKIYILEASIYLFWMQIKSQQSFLETLLLGNLCLLCNLVGQLCIVCGGTVYFLKPRL